jgi:transposase
MKFYLVKGNIERFRARFPEIDFSTDLSYCRDAEAGVFKGGMLTEEFLSKMPNLKWVQLTSAGFNRPDFESLLRRGITLTCARGAYSEPCAEDVVCKLLVLEREVKKYILKQGKVLGGIGTVENAYDHTMCVRGFTADKLPKGELEMIELCRKVMPSLPVDEADILLVDTLGLVWMVVVHSAGVQDRDGARLVLERFLERVKDGLKRLELIWADGIYAGELVGWVQEKLAVVLEIVKRSDDVAGFVVLPHRWVVERTFAWLGRYRRLSKDYELLPESSETMIYLAMINLMLRRLKPEKSP